MVNEPSWKRWLRKQSASKVREICEIAIERLIETEEVAFYMDDYVDKNGNEIPEDETVEEHLYWKGSGAELCE